MTICCVCTGNTCRSPMAEALLRRELSDRSDVTICSAGLSIIPGSAVSLEAVTVLHEIGLDIAGRPAQPMTPVLAAADRFLVMSAGHAAVLSRCFAVPAEKITVLGHGIPDPFGGPEALYRETRDALLAALRDWLSGESGLC